MGTDIRLTPPELALKANATDLTTEVTNRQNADTAHVAASDPHGDRAYATSIQLLPRKFFIPAADTPNAHLNFASNVGFGSGLTFTNQRLSSGAQNDWIEWDVLMDAGTWTFDLYFRSNTSYGIYSLSIDGGATVGTVDSYAAAPAVGLGAISAVSVPTAGRKKLRLTMATKNGSSSAYVGYLTGFSGAKTA